MSKVETARLRLICREKRQPRVDTTQIETSMTLRRTLGNYYFDFSQCKE